MILKNRKPLTRETARGLKPGTRLVYLGGFGNKAQLGDMAEVGPRGLFVSHGSTYIDVKWLGNMAGVQNDGGYHYDSFAVAHRSLAPQAKEVLKMLTEVGRITGVQAWNILKVRSLPRRIADLKEAGHDIKKTMKEDHTGQRYAEYTLA